MKLIDYYNTYNQNVIEFFKNNKKELLVIDLTNGEGWAPLCEFLEKPIPVIPFPHENPAKTVPLNKNISKETPAPNIVTRILRKIKK